MFDARPEERVTAGHLVRFVVPLIERQLLVERELVAATECFDEALDLKEGGDGGQGEDMARGKWKREEKEKGWVLSYEGISHGV
jgi:hypothetical protein